MWLMLSFFVFICMQASLVLFPPVEVLLIQLRLCPTVPRKAPSPARTGSFGGRKPSNGSPHGSPVYWGELKLPPRMGGVETPPISLITPFLYDINPV